MTAREFAILKLQRRHLATVQQRMVCTQAAGAVSAAVDYIDELLSQQPARAEKIPADRKVAALQAHRTRVLKKMKGTRGKMRDGLKAKLADFDTRLGIEPVVVLAEKAPRRKRAPKVEQVELLDAA